LELGEAYCNEKAAKQFIVEIGNHFEDAMKKILTDAPYFSVFCDGTTDRTETEKELIMIKVMHDHHPTMMFLRLEEPPNTKSVGIISALDNAFRHFGVDNWKGKMLGFCSDGASVMMGERNGVATVLKRDSPWLLVVWCLAHRLELAVKDTFKKTYMDTVIENLTAVYYFYRGSSKRNREANELAEILEEEFLKPVKANGTRWVEHKLLAITKMLTNYSVVISHMMSYAEDVTNKAEDRTKTKGIIRKLLQFKFVYFMYFVKDVLTEISRVSLVFQRDDICLQRHLMSSECFCYFKRHDSKPRSTTF
jgi:hypothetical protein